MAKNDNDFPIAGGVSSNNCRGMLMEVKAEPVYEKLGNF